MPGPLLFTVLFYLDLESGIRNFADETYNFCTKTLCRLPIAQSNSYGLNSLSFRGSLLWNTLDDEIKRTGTLTNFKKGMAKWDGNIMYLFEL